MPWMVDAVCPSSLASCSEPLPACLKRLRPSVGRLSVSHPRSLSHCQGLLPFVSKTARLKRATQSVGTKWFSEPQKVHGL